MSEMEELYKRINKFEENQAKMNENLETVVEALIGNKLTKAGGMIKELQKTNERLDNLDADIRELKKFKDRIVWTVMGLLTLGSALSWIFSKVIESIK